MISGIIPAAILAALNEQSELISWPKAAPIKLDTASSILLAAELLQRETFIVLGAVSTVQ